MEWHCTIGALSTRDVDDSDSSSSCSPYAVCSLSSSEIGRLPCFLCSCFLCSCFLLSWFLSPWGCIYVHVSFVPYGIFVFHSYQLTLRSSQHTHACLFAHHALSSRHVSYYYYYYWVSSPHARSAGLDRADRQLRGRAQSKGAGTRTRNHVVRKTSARSRPGATPRMPHT